MATRAVALYIAGWLMVRIGEHRVLGKNTAFDIVLGFIFGSLLSRAINGSAPFLETVVAGIVLLTLHWAFLTVAFHSGRMDELINGKVRRLISAGKVDRTQMRKARMNQRILRENLRMNGGVTDPEQVAEADFEPSGSLSVIPKAPAPRIIDVDVREGVQTIRIELAR